MNGEYAGHDFAPPLALDAYDDGQQGQLIKLLGRTIELLEQLVEQNGGAQPRPRRRTDSVASSSKTVMTRSWLRVTLKIEGPLPWATITAMAEKQGFSERTLRRVRHDVAVKEYQDGHQVNWRLKED